MAAVALVGLVAQGRVGGVLGAGGSSGSSIAARVMAGLPVGPPKLPYFTRHPAGEIVGWERPDGSR